MLPPALLSALNQLPGINIQGSQAIAGGDINRAALLHCADGRRLFLKYNRHAQAADMLHKERLGLSLLGASQVIRTPKVIAQDAAPEGWAYLLMEYVPPGHRNRQFWADFGAALAALHGSTSALFGFAHDNYIGSLPQSNTRHENWPDFYTQERLRPQMELARKQGRLQSTDAQQLERLCAKLSTLCPDEPPALIHGDLWSGNFLCDFESKPVLIDPAACYAHREMDLAMTYLFGGFDPAFYAAYQEHLPLEPGFEGRLEVYQLYYLLVHVNLFGGGYVEQVKGILRRF